MFRFFRSIRQKLLNENKTLRYMKYAVGEVILIMIGIFLALQLNNWNDRRLDRIEEREILKRISKEVERNIDEMTLRKEPLQSKAEALGRLMMNFEAHNYKNPMAFLNDVISGCRYGWTHPEIQVFIFEEFQSSGKFGLVRNKELLNRIMEFYNNNSQFENRADFRASIMLDIAADLIPFQDGRAGVLEEKLTDSQYRAIAEKVLNSDLHLHLIREQNRGEFLNRQWEDLIEQGTLLLAEIEAELTK